jgi:hypothetical protein
MLILKPNLSKYIIYTVYVWLDNPSTQSTKIKAPSVSLSANETSELNSTWPGESIKLIKNYSLSYNFIYKKKLYCHKIMK